MSTKIIAQNSWLIAVQNKEFYYTSSIEIRFVPNVYDITVSKTDIIKIAKKFMPLLAKKMGLPARYFTPALYFCSMEGYGAKDTIFVDRFSKKEEKIMANIVQAFADIEEDISELVSERGESIEEDNEEDNPKIIDTDNVWPFVVA
jgi:hypothetical protein